MRLLRFLFKTALALVIVIVLAIGGMFLWEQSRPAILGSQAVTMVQEMLGGKDSQQYQYAQTLASRYGIDLEDEQQMGKLAIENIDKLNELKTISEQARSGEISQEEAIARLQTILGTPNPW